MAAFFKLLLLPGRLVHFDEQCLSIRYAGGFTVSEGAKLSEHFKGLFLSVPELNIRFTINPHEIHPLSLDL